MKRPNRLAQIRETIKMVRLDPQDGRHLRPQAQEMPLILTRFHNHMRPGTSPPIGLPPTNFRPNKYRRFQPGSRKNATSQRGGSALAMSPRNGNPHAGERGAQAP